MVAGRRDGSDLRRRIGLKGHNPMQGQKEKGLPCMGIFIKLPPETSFSPRAGQRNQCENSGRCFADIL